MRSPPLSSDKRSLFIITLSYHKRKIMIQRLKTAGIFQDDPHFEDVKHYINEYRQEIEAIEESVS